MKTSQKLSLTVMPLLAAAFGWWLLSVEEKISAPAPESGAHLTEPAESSPLQVIVYTRPAEETRSDAVEKTFVATDPLPSDGDEDQSETLARRVEQMGAAELISRLQELPLEDLRGNPGRLLVRRWAELNPAAAGRWVTQLGDEAARQELSTAVALAWSERDLTGALDWAYSLSGGDTQSRVLTELGYEVARVDPVESMRLAVELPASDTRDGLLLHALRQWASQEPEQSQQWALQLSPGPLREQALAAVATVMANHDGERAARFAVEHVLPGPEHDRAIIGIVQRWVQVDYDQTAAWVELFPQTPLRHTAMLAMADIAGSTESSLMSPSLRSLSP